MLTVVGLLGTACGAEPEPPGSLPDFAGTPRDVVVDTDLGADDAVALVYLLRRPEVRVRAVTVSGTGLVHCPRGAAVARAVLALAGRSEVPVACGRTSAPGGHPLPAAWRVDADHAGGLRVAPGGAAGEAAALLAQTTSQAPGQVSVLALGPLTNVADALQRGADPADVTLMGGTVGGPGNVGNVPGVEWNLHADPRSAAAVLASPVPLTVVPLEATDDVPVAESFTSRARDAASGKDAEWAARRMADLVGLSFWDPLAAAALVDPALVRARSATLSVDPDSGALRDDQDAGRPVRLAVSADRDEFEAGLLAALAATG
jgi:inosine-uridine nucleoside N-ribohydrolase